MKTTCAAQATNITENRSEDTVLIHFGAKWCKPCRVMNEVLQNVVSEVSPRLKIVHADVEEMEDLTEQLEIDVIPAFLVLQGDKVRARLTGMTTRQKLLDMVKLASKPLS